MRSCVLLVLASSVALADGQSRIEAMLRSRDAFVALLDDPVQVRGVLFADDTCQRRFGHPQMVHGSDRGALADCLLALHPRSLGFRIGAAFALQADLHDLGDDLVVGLTPRGHYIGTIGGATAMSGRDADLPTTTRFDTIVAPSTAVEPSIAKVGGHVSVAMEVCHDEQGLVTARKLAHASTVAAYDAEVVAHYAAIDRMKVTVFRGKPIAVCELLVVANAPPSPAPNGQ